MIADMIKRLFCVFFCFLLCLQVYASPDSGLAGEIEAFMEEHQLDESNFSVSYYNLKERTDYNFNENRFVPIGRLWALPLHMYFYEEETNGNFQPVTDPEDFNARPEEFRIDSLTLDECRYRSIILGENQVAEKMLGHIGTHMQYQQIINDRYGKIPPNELPLEYWDIPVYSTRFLMNCIQNVSFHSELFGDLMANYRLAQKVDAFADGSVPYTVVQIRGSQDGHVTAIAEVSAPQPFLIAASVTEEAGGDAILSALNVLICHYIERSVGEEITTQPTESTAKSTTPNYYIGQERMEPDSRLNRLFLFAFIIAGIIALIIAVIVFLWRRKHSRY